MTIAWDEVFGEPFTSRTAPLGADDEGDLVATVIHRPVDTNHRAVLAGTDEDAAVVYVHGWSDYFLHRGLADHLAAGGVETFGIDLRKHGRSLRPGQTPYSIASLDDYDAEFDEVLADVGPDRRIVLIAHSTGGLTATLWASRHPDRVAALLLVSPWLELHTGAPLRRSLTSPFRRLAEKAPRSPALPLGSSLYSDQLHVDRQGEWDYRLDWKPLRAPVPRDLFAAVLDGFAELDRLAPLPFPVLTLTSGTSYLLPVPSPIAGRSDTILRVSSMRARASALSPAARVVVVDGAFHDVLLSAAGPRRTAYALIDDFLREHLDGFDAPVYDPAADRGLGR